MGYTTAILYSTAVCNLNCTYCYINKNKGLSAIDRVLAGSFADPDYYFDFIRDYFPHRGDLQNLEIWGAETFRHMGRPRTFFTWSGCTPPSTSSSGTTPSSGGSSPPPTSPTRSGRTRSLTCWNSFRCTPPGGST